MGEDYQALRDELLYRQVKGGRSMYLGVTIAFAFATLLTIAYAIGIVVLDKGISALFADISMGLPVAVFTWFYWNQYKEHAQALEEIGDSPVGIDTCKTYSLKTAQLIAGSRKSKDVLRQLWIAYGIMAVMMIGFGILLLLLIMEDSSAEMILIISGAVMWIGGLLLLTLAVRAFRDWLMARRLEKLEKSYGATPQQEVAAPQETTNS